jgi:hypothetical protein
MTTYELKNLLVHRISEINDVSFLKAIKTLLDSKAETKYITLSKEERAEIIASKIEIEKGLYIDNDQLNQETQKWLNGK